MESYVWVCASLVRPSSDVTRGVTRGVMCAWSSGVGVATSWYDWSMERAGESSSMLLTSKSGNAYLDRCIEYTSYLAT